MDRLRLKWILNADDEIVLMECLEYRVDAGKCLRPSKNNDRHVERILRAGVELLRDGYVIEDMESMHHSHHNI